jgi:hypothetical protein
MQPYCKAIVDRLPETEFLRQPAQRGVVEQHLHDCVYYCAMLLPQLTAVPFSGPFLAAFVMTGATEGRE